MGLDVPEIIIDLIERFERNLDAYRSGSYNETQLRREFLDPFFDALGWDVHNKKGYAEAYKDVIHEDSISIGGATKAPDYCFRIGGTRKFFVEAKKPSVKLKDEISPAFQLRRYAWSAKLPLSILTDFEEFAVYDCRVKPVQTDKASASRVMYLTFKDYVEKWDEIASIFSRDAVLKGSFDKYAEKGKKRGTAEVDDAFLNEIEFWRESLARNIALRNPALTQRELNVAVQVTIDRLIFLRICEDRAIEHYGKLQSLLNGTNVYRRLLELFRQADEKYNSGLFHFEKEKGRVSPPDELTPSLEIDDKHLKDIIRRLYSPDSPYEFSVLPADILGQVYEQFLGKVIRLTSGHQAKVEDKPEVRKAGGVYYTPTYIVDYIVKNTVGKIAEKKKPKDIDKIRILDPACGSGSFLLGAYQCLLDWHRDWYVDDDAEKWAKGRKPTLYQAQGGEWRLTTAEKKRILLNNIYGVDIDPQAVEVTKLSLLLKVLEGESEQTLNYQLKMFHERALPDLASNIKCGNSLIGPDFFEQKLILDDEECLRINAFDWNAEFPEIMKVGGFDAVIGNPPYVRQESLGDFKNYFNKSYKVYHGSADLYSYFIEKGVSLLRKDGLFSYIVANKWMRANYGEPLRKWMKEQGLEEIVDFGDLPVFKKATTYPCIIRIKKDARRENFNAAEIKTLDFTDLGEHIKGSLFSINKGSLDDSGWNLVDEGTKKLLDKLQSKGVPLEECVDGKIFRGVLTGLNEAFVINKETKDLLLKKDPRSAELIKPFLLGKDIKRYVKPENKRHLILIEKGWTNKQLKGKKSGWNWLCENYPAITDYLAPFKEKGEKRYDKGEYWWELRACDYYREFEKPKIIYAEIATKGQFAIDIDKNFSDTTSYIIPSESLFLLGILNSKLFTFLFSSISSEIRGGFFRWKRQYMSIMPIKVIDASNPAEKTTHNKMVSFVDKMLSLNKQLSSVKTDHENTALQRQIDATDKQIDRLVYDLYGLTEDEIRIVES